MQAVAWLLLLVPPVAAEPTPLFNGRDLAGWITPTDKALFVVEDGAIVGRTMGDLKKNEFLVTDRTYKDFTLKIKARLTSGNSGVQFRSTRAEDGAVSGPQADIADGYWGLFYEERGRGILDQAAVERAKSVLKKDDWNEYEITAKGSQVTIKLNGETMVDRTDPVFAAEGVIALQVHVGAAMEIRFKDITIEELK